MLLLWHSASAELDRRMRGPGGQQAGIPPMAGWPPSVLISLERELRQALEHTPAITEAELSTYDCGAREAFTTGATQ